MALCYVLSFPFWGNSVPLGHPCSQSCSLQDSVFYAIVSFCDTLRSFFVFVFSILVSSIFPRKPILTAFFFSLTSVFPHLPCSQNLFHMCSYLIQIVIQHHLWKTIFFLTLQLLPYSCPAYFWEALALICQMSLSF